MKADAPGGNGPGDPGLGQLFGLLTSDPTRDEVSGRAAAMTMFRENFQPAAPSGRRRARRGHRRTAPRHTGLPPSAPPPSQPGAPPPSAPRRGARRVALLATAVVVAIVGGFAGVAYSAALPAPVQHIAYHVLGFAGVPDARHGRPHHSAARHTRHSPPARQPGSSGSPGPSAGSTMPGAPSRSPTPGARSPSRSGPPKPFQPPPPPGPLLLTATAAHRQIAAGAAETFTARLTRPGGRSVQGGQLVLLEHAAGQSDWRTAGHATTGPDGHAVLTVSGLTASATFQVTGPGGAQSQSLDVTVLLPVKLSTTSHGGAIELKARSPLAHPGDQVVLQVRSGRHWPSKRMRRLDGAGRASFAVRPLPGGRVYRVVLVGTAAHGRSVSSTVTVR